MIYLLIFTLLIISLFFANKFLKNVQPDDLEISKDLESLKESVSIYRGGLVDWDKGISSSELDQIIQRNKQKSGKGVIMSPDNNPVFAYAFKSYIGPTKNNIIYVLGNQQEYTFRTNSKGTEISVDGQKIGLLRPNGVFNNVQNSEIAKVQKNSLKGESKLFMGEKEVVKIKIPDNISESDAISVKDKELLSRNLELVKSIAILEIINLE